MLWLKFNFTSAFRNLARTPRRTLVSIIAIAAATAAMLLFESFVTGVKSRFRTNIMTTNFGHYKLFQKGYQEHQNEDPLAYQIPEPEKLKAAIRDRVGNLAFISERQEFYGLISKNNRSIGAKGLGIHSAEEEKFLTAVRIVEGNNLSSSPVDSMLLGEGLKAQLSAKLGETLTVLVTTETGSLNAFDFTVTGVFRTGVKEIDDSLFYVDASKASALLRVSGASQVVLAFKTEDELAVRPALEKAIQETFPNVQVFHWHDLMGEYFDNTMLWLEAQFKVFRVIILLIAALSIANVFMMGILERTGEFGTMRALGSQRWEVWTLILVESIVQAAMGSLTGLLLALGVLQLLTNGITMPPPPQMSTAFLVVMKMPWSSVPGTLLAATLVAGAAGVFPGAKIVRMNIAAALGRNV